MKRILSLILAFCTIATLFTSCGESDTSKEPGGEKSDTATHSHVFTDGKCECGESDPNHKGEDEMESFVYSATVLPVKGGANGIIVLQHDDAYYDTAIIMDNLLREYGLCADVAMLSNRVWNYSNGTAKADEVAKWREILDTGRWKITSHSATHTWWGKATALGDGTYNTYDDIEKMTAEVIGSQEILRSLFPDQRVLTFAYPGFTSEKNKYTDGSEKEILEVIYSEAMRKMLDEHYIAGRRVQAAYSVTDTTIDWTMSGCYHIGGNYTNNKVEKAAEDGLLTVLYVHNMANVPEDQLKTYNYPSNTMAAYYFEDTCKKLAARVASGEVWNTHYEDAIMYVREAQSATATVRYANGGLTVSLTDKMDDSVYNFPLTVRIALPEAVKAVKITQNGKVSYAKTEYEAYEFYGGEYYALCDIVPDSGDAKIEFIPLSDVPEEKPEEPKPSPTLPEPDAPVNPPDEDPNKPADARLYASVNFDESTAGFTDTSTCSTVERVTPSGRDNAAIHINKTSNDATDRFYFEAGGKVTDAKEITVSFSINITESNNILVLQTLFSDLASTTPYNLTVRSKSDGFVFGELPSNSAISGAYSFGEWHTVELKMTFGEDGSFLASLTVDGELAGTSTQFTSSLSSDSTKPSRTVSRIGFYLQKSALTDLYLDDVTICVK